IFEPEAIVDPVGVKNLNSTAKVVKTEYFNIMGAKLSEPSNGVNIVIKTMSDGSIVTTKSVFKK
ncbi:MAG: hypothetical protein KA807_02280, partial [Prolixibacteraceae bacterium]|nr:hypothetical protein [Prolixibacteraceae bacterium]